MTTESSCDSEQNLNESIDNDTAPWTKLHVFLIEFQGKKIVMGFLALVWYYKHNIHIDFTNNENK